MQDSQGVRKIILQAFEDASTSVVDNYRRILISHEQRTAMYISYLNTVGTNSLDLLPMGYAPVTFPWIVDELFKIQQRVNGNSEKANAIRKYLTEVEQAHVEHAVKQLRASIAHFKASKDALKQQMNDRTDISFKMLWSTTKVAYEHLCKQFGIAQKADWVEFDRKCSRSIWTYRSDFTFANSQAAAKDAKLHNFFKKMKNNRKRFKITTFLNRLETDEIIHYKLKHLSDLDVDDKFAETDFMFTIQDKYNRFFDQINSNISTYTDAVYLNYYSILFNGFQFADY